MEFRDAVLSPEKDTQYVIQILFDGKWRDYIFHTDSIHARKILSTLRDAEARVFPSWLRRTFRLLNRQKVTKVEETVIA